MQLGSSWVSAPLATNVDFWNTIVPQNMLRWIQGVAILRDNTSDVNRLRHWRMHVRSNILRFSKGIWRIKYAAFCLRHYHN